MLRAPRTPDIVFLFALGVLVAPRAHAELSWRGDFETGTTSQWSYLLNATGITVVTDPTLEGTHAGRIEIDASHLWPNGLNRVEFQYAPPSAQSEEGADSYFGFSFLFPQLLTSDSHQIAYYESNNTYQQVLSVGVQGDLLTLSTRQPQNVEHLRAAGAIQAGKWHDLVLHVHWSRNAADGRVDLWLDGEQLVSDATAQTRADDNPHFIQLGILRDTIETTEVMYIDNARAGTVAADVLDLVPDVSGSGGAAPATGGAAATGGNESGTGGSTSNGGQEPSATSGGASASGGVNDSDPNPTGGADTVVTPQPNLPSQSGGGCSTSPRRASSALALLLSLFVVRLGRRWGRAEL